MIRLPLSQTGPADKFAQAVDAHIQALTSHMMGKPGKPAPRASDLIERVIMRQAQGGPVATRSPDRFMAMPYEIYDDSPQTPEQELALSVLRETVG
jgi:hypothetical protein